MQGIKQWSWDFNMVLACLASTTLCCEGMLWGIFLGTKRGFKGSGPGKKLVLTVWHRAG